MIIISLTKLMIFKINSENINYKAPVVIDDKIQIRSQMEISIAVDHRIIDGADGAKYLARLKEIIENPELLLI